MTMQPLFDFGISQEDPATEQAILVIRQGDHILSIASGGEVPLGLLSLNENIRITAIDTSLAQIMLCRLKLITALSVSFPLNAGFLGYSELKRTERVNIYNHYIRPQLDDSEIAFWQSNMESIGNGIVSSGRFEKYISKMRLAGRLIIGKKNLDALIACKTCDEQNRVFSDKIASRYILKLLFKIAFHPKIYKNRGLSEQALIHASEDTGQRFFRRFNEFCTAGKATENYFLQYFLTGKCITDDSFPDYLKPCNKDRLMANQDSIEFRHIGFAEFMKSEDKLQYNKIHFSNLGDWMNLADFNRCMESVKSKCMPGTRICYRYLQKDHCELGNPKGFDIVRSGLNTNPDRFPFYTTYLITLL